MANKELQTRVDDLERALRTIGEILADTTLTPRQRSERSIGIVNMHVSPKVKA